MGGNDYPIRGSAYGSMWQLTVVYLVALEALFVTLAVTHGLGWRPVVVVAVCAPLMAYITQSMSPVVVSMDGVSVSVFTVSVDVPWANIVSMQPTLTGVRLQLREAQAFGRRETSTVGLVQFDLLWRSRRTTLAVQAWLTTHSSSTT